MRDTSNNLMQSVENTHQKNFKIKKYLVTLYKLNYWIMWPFKKKIKKEKVSCWDIQLELDKGFAENRQIFEDKNIFLDFKNQLDRNWLENCMRLHSARIKLNSIKDRYGKMNIDITEEQYNKYYLVCNRLCKELLLTFEEFVEVKQNPIDSRYLPSMFIYFPRIYTIYDSATAKYVNDKLPEAFYEEYYKQLEVFCVE